MRRWAAAPLLAVLLAGGGHGQDPTSPVRRNPLQLEIHNPKDRFIIKEALAFTVVIRNTGTKPITVPKILDNRNKSLTYELGGPSVSGIYRFHYGSAADFQLPGGPAERTLAPGETMEDVVDIVQFVANWKPGQHAIRFRLGDVVSNAFNFTLEHAKVKSAQVLSDGPQMTPGMIRIAFLEDNGYIYQGFYSEADGTVETPATSKFVPAVKVPAAAQSTLVPWTNFDRASVFFSRFGWEQKGEIGVAEVPQAPPIELPLAGATVLHPALMVESGAMNLFLLRGQNLTLARIPHEDGKPQNVWQCTLPGGGVAGGSALGPVASGSPLAAAVVIPHTEAISIAVVQDGKFRSHRFEKLHVLPNSTPAIAFAAGGEIRTSVVVADSADLKNAVILDLIWEAGKPEPRMSKSNPIPLTAKVSGASAVYAPVGEPPRRDWVIAFADGTVVSSREPQVHRHFGSGPVLPLQLAARQQQTYLLVNDPVEVLGLALLH